MGPRHRQNGGQRRERPLRRRRSAFAVNGSGQLSCQDPLPHLCAPAHLLGCLASPQLLLLSHSNRRSAPRAACGRWCSSTPQTHRPDQPAAHALWRKYFVQTPPTPTRCCCAHGYSGALELSYSGASASRICSCCCVECVCCVACAGLHRAPQQAPLACLYWLLSQAKRSSAHTCVLAAPPLVLLSRLDLTELLSPSGKSLL
jgi:hypothetical protein